MKRTFILILLLFILTACGQSEVSPLINSSDNPANISLDDQNQGNVPEDSGLQPSVVEPNR